MSIQKKAAVALGLFDGVHEGHRAVLQAALRQKKNGLVPSVFTFRSEMASQKHAPGYLYTTNLKTWLLENTCGMERIYAPPFELICAMSGDEFVRSTLHERMNAAYVCCGKDFRFGRDARWDVTDLQKLGGRYGFTVEVIDDVRIGGVTVSSSEIRRLMAEGDLKKANLLLGEPYMLRGTVKEGAGLGHTIGFPTANIPFKEGQLVPKFGVYASETRTPDGTWHLSVTNIGMKPTVHYDGMPLSETYIDGYVGTLYGEKIRIVLTKLLREEMQFDSVEALQAQMEKDMVQRWQLSKTYHLSDT